MPAEIATDFGVTDDTIRIGLNADLSGIFAPLVTQIVDGQEAYWEIVNDNGGIAGRQVELVVLDNAYDVPTHLENYEEMAAESDDGVVMFSQSTGSPHTAATAAALVEDDLLAIPLSWYSGWADPTIGENVLELYTSYCLESMNGLTYLAGAQDASTVAIISFPGEYGQDGAFGAKAAAEALGLEVVYDGEGAVVPGSDQTPVITELVNAQPDLVWATINPTTLAEIMGGAVRPGPAGAVVGELADVQLPVVGHRPRTGPRRAVHALDVHPALELGRFAGADGDGRGHAGASGPRRRSPTSTSWPGPRDTRPSRSSRRQPPTAT